MKELNKTQITKRIKINDMSKILNVLAILLFGLWAIGFFMYDLIIISHIFLVSATVILIIRVLKEK